MYFFKPMEINMSPQFLVDLDTHDFLETTLTTGMRRMNPLDNPQLIFNL